MVKSATLRALLACYHAHCSYTHCKWDKYSLLVTVCELYCVLGQCSLQYDFLFCLFNSYVCMSDYDRHSGVSSMLESLNWPRLGKGSVDFISTRKLTSYLVYLYHPTFYQRNIQSDTITQIILASSHTSYYQKSIFTRTIVEWNNLPSSVIYSANWCLYQSTVWFIVA